VRTSIPRAVHEYLNQRIYASLARIDGIFFVAVEDRLECLLQRPKYEDPKKLNRYEFGIFSQSGEDGIIAEIFRRIGPTNRTFVEFGVGDGRQNNTRYLLTTGWSGTWIEGNEELVIRIRKQYAEKIKQGTLHVSHALVTAEVIESLLERNGVPQEFDLLSIDIDCNDYWVWAAIQRFRPRVVIIEYNAFFPPGHEWVIDYAPDAVWDGTRNFGASLTALEVLGAKKGYKLVGCNLAGVNAFFVREDLVRDNFCAPFTAGNHHEPVRYYLLH
jgi:hypothetical protein